MGNKTNPKKWDARQRLAFIEEAAFWRGWVTRGDLELQFGISLSQISADFKAYLEINPAGLRYDLSAKRYWGMPRMTMKLGEPDLRGAINRFLGPDAKGGTERDQFATIDLPARAVGAAVARDVFRAVARGFRLEIHYYALTSGRAQWRWISPHAFAHDGYRWHVRAYCHEDGSYKDFVLGRIAESRSPAAAEAGPLPPDDDWHTWDTIRMKPHRQLDGVQRRAVELDYNMRGGAVTLRVRRSMREYTLAYLRVREDPSMPRQLELDENP